MALGNVQKMGYTIKQKIDICLMAEANPEMTQLDLANWANKKYHTIKPPSQTTISRILSKKDELIALKEHEFKLIRRRKPSNVLLREILTEWISQSVWEGTQISVPVVQNSAASLWQIIPPGSREGNGVFSHKWCTHFLTKLKVGSGDCTAGFVRPEKVWNLPEETLQLQQKLKSISLKDIFVLDEFFLLYDLPLDRSCAANEDVFSNRAGVSVLLTTNADGSEKLEPLMVGHHENMGCLDAKQAAKLSKKYEVNYKNNRKAYLTSTLLSDWLSTLDKRLAIGNRDIVIILDDAVSHRMVNLNLEYIKLIYVHNPNIDLSFNESLKSPLTPCLPMQTGIFREFKVLYRLQQYLLSKSLQTKQQDAILQPNQYKIALTDVMIMIKNSWANVSVEVIRNAFISADIIDFEEYTSLEFQGISIGKTSTSSNDHKKIWGDEALNNRSKMADQEAHHTTSLTQNTATDFKNSEYKLLSAINNLKVYEKWDIDTLTNLRAEDKFLKYSSPQEMVDCCITDGVDPEKNMPKPKDLIKSEASLPDTLISSVTPDSNSNSPGLQNSIQNPGMQSGNDANDMLDFLPNFNDTSSYDKFNDNSNELNLLKYSDNNDLDAQINDAIFDFNNLDTDNKDFLFGFDDVADTQDNSPSIFAPKYNQHVNKYSTNSLYSEPVKKGNLSSIITIPDNSRSFGVLYNKKRKVSSLDNDDANPSSLFSSPSGIEAMSNTGSYNSNQTTSKHSSNVSSPIDRTRQGSNFSTSINPMDILKSSRMPDFNSSMSNTGPQEKAQLLQSVITLANNGEITLSESCVLELLGELCTIQADIGSNSMSQSVNSFNQSN